MLAGEDGDGSKSGAAKEVNLEALASMLAPVEGDQLAQDNLFWELQSRGACMIVTVDVGDDVDPIRMVSVLKYLRVYLALTIWSNSVRLVKADGNRFFIFATTAGMALKAALSMKLLMRTFHSWIADVCPDVGQLSRQATLKAGIHHGGLLLLEEDCFGDPVNTASKLGEDLAEFGEIMVSASSSHNQADEDMKALKARCEFKQKTSEISGLSLDYCCINTPKLEEVAPFVNAPTKQEVEDEFGRTGKSASMEKQELCIVTSDMSGFTRLTKAYGILHFLRLVLKVRSIFLPAMEKVGGWKVKYEGDNIIAAFPSVDVAIQCLKFCKGEIAAYNETRQKDFQVRIGFGLDIGEVQIQGHDIVGPAFDCSFKLAEDIAEVGEVLVSQRVKAMGWPSTQSSTKVSEERVLEGTGEKYYCVSFV